MLSISNYFILKRFRKYRVIYNYSNNYLYLNSHYKVSIFFKNLNIKLLYGRIVWNKNLKKLESLFYTEFRFFIKTIFFNIFYNLIINIPYFFSLSSIFYANLDFFFNLNILNFIKKNVVNIHTPHSNIRSISFYLFYYKLSQFEFDSAYDLFFNHSYKNILNYLGNNKLKNFFYNNKDLKPWIIENSDYFILNSKNYSIFRHHNLFSFIYYDIYLSRISFFLGSSRVNFIGYSLLYSLSTLNAFFNKLRKSYLNLLIYKYLPSKIKYFNYKFNFFEKFSYIKTLNKRGSHLLGEFELNSIKIKKRFFFSFISFYNYSIGLPDFVYDFFFEFRNYFSFYNFTGYDNLVKSYSSNNMAIYWYFFRICFSLKFYRSLVSSANKNILFSIYNRGKFKSFLYHFTGDFNTRYFFNKSKSVFSNFRYRNLKNLGKDISVFKSSKFFYIILWIILNNWFLNFSDMHNNSFFLKNNFIYNNFDIKRHYKKMYFPQKYFLNYFNMSFNTPYFLSYSEVNFRIRQVSLLPTTLKESLNYHVSLSMPHLRLLLIYLYRHY